MQADQVKHLEAFFEDACTGALSAFSLEAEPQEASTETFNHCAVIGFTSSTLRGTLGIATSQENLAALLQSVGGEDNSIHMMLDCLGELSNQSLGRLKNILYRYNITISLSTPMVLHGLSISVSHGHQDIFIHRDFRTPYGQVSAWLSGHCDGEVNLEEVDQDCQTQDEGDMLFFSPAAGRAAACPLSTLL